MVLTDATSANVEKFLLDNGIITKKVLDSAKDKAAREDMTVIDAMVSLKAITNEDAIKAVAVVTHTPFVDLTNQMVNDEVMELVPKDVAETYQAVPFSITEGDLNVAMVDPTNLQAIDFLTKKTGHPVKAYMTTRESLGRLLAAYHEDLSSEVTRALGGADKAKEEAEAKEAEQAAQKLDSKNIAIFVQDAPITRALNTILEYAVNSRASDIHIEPRERVLKIRYRIDGLLQDTMTLPKTIEPALVSRIKILSNLKIDEHRIPQDGQANFKVGTHEVDLRIAISPTAYGEQVVIRILDKTAQLITLENLGFRGLSFRRIGEAIKKPHGMVLSTGPTGSGKTTTMYAIIQKVKNVAINIITLEDPIEYKIDDINQIQVNPGVGLTFATGLRSILRQDPNVIMVGEIRDRETADLAVQSSLTGHLVLSTLHTNSASGVLPRMLDMNIEPFLIASTVNVVIGQRLVRKICEHCKVEINSSQSATAMINRALKNVLPKDESERAAKTEELGYENLPTYSENAYTLFKGQGCEQCVSGYLGRTGIYEVFDMNEAMEKLLLQHATTTEIQKQAVTDGMLTMQQDGLLKVLTGITTIEEVARVASDY